MKQPALLTLRTPLRVSDQGLHDVVVVIVFQIHERLKLLFAGDRVNALARVRVRNFYHCDAAHSCDPKWHFFFRHVPDSFGRVDRQSAFDLRSVVDVVRFGGDQFVSTSSQTNQHRVVDQCLGHRRDAVPRLLSDVSKRSTNRNPLAVVKHMKDAVFVKLRCPTHVVFVKWNQPNVFIGQFGERCRVARVLHVILVIEHRDVAFDAAFSNLNLLQERLAQQPFVTRHFDRLVHTRHRLLAGRTRVGFDHDNAAVTCFRCDMKQVTSAPTKILWRGAQQRLYRFGVNFGVKVAKPRCDAIVTHLHEISHQRMDMSVEHAWVKVILWLKCTGRHKSWFS